jgi:hypothetical protein
MAKVRTANNDAPETVSAKKRSDDSQESSSVELQLHCGYAMKADDPRLEGSLREVSEHVNRVNEMIVTVLKNHLVVAQFMDEFLASCGKKA